MEAVEAEDEDVGEVREVKYLKISSLSDHWHSPAQQNN